ncbi:fusl family protein [Megaselia abdita]
MKELEFENPTTTKDQKQSSQKSQSVKKRLYSILICSLDTLFSMAIGAPCVVVYWRGTWELSAHVLEPFGMLYSSLVSLAVGLIGYYMLAIVQKPLTRFLNPSKHRLSYFVVSRIYTFVFAFVSVNMWRGIWSLCDYFTGTDSLIITSALTGFTFVCLLGTRTLRNLLASPFGLAADHYNGYFDVDTLFRIQGSKAPGLFILDTFYSVFIISVLVVVTWRGVWGIFDLTFYTDNILYSAWGSTILGYSISILGFILQPFVQFILENIKGKFKIIFISDVFMTFCFLGAINIWRGIWMMADVYILPDDFIMSCWITHALGYIVLVMLNCSNTLIVRGVLIDGQEKSGECVSFPNRFIRVYFERQREKKYNYLQLQQQQSQSDTPEKV